MVFGRLLVEAFVAVVDQVIDEDARLAILESTKTLRWRRAECTLQATSDSLMIELSTM